MCIPVQQEFYLWKIDKSGRIELVNGIMQEPDRQKLVLDYKVTLRMKSNPEKANADQTKNT